MKAEVVRDDFGDVIEVSVGRTTRWVVSVGYWGDYEIKKYEGRHLVGEWTRGFLKHVGWPVIGNEFATLMGPDVARCVTDAFQDRPCV